MFTIQVGNLKTTQQGIRVDRSSSLGNPFKMRSEAERDAVCDGYEEYFDRVDAGKMPTEAASQVAQSWGLEITSAWKRPTQAQFKAELERVGSALRQDPTQPILCWCAKARCHGDTVARYWERSLSGVVGIEPQRLAEASPDRITQLNPNQVFVFGSNTEGRHGKGAALSAQQWGAKYSNPQGRQGQTYAIVTKDLRQGERSIPLVQIEAQIDGFLKHARSHPQDEFLVTKIGCSLAGYSEDEIGALWKGKEISLNVRLPQAFIDVIGDKTSMRRKTNGGSSQRTDLKIISGGQTGADYGALLGAQALGIETAGYAPAGWLVERDPRFLTRTNPDLAQFGLIEAPKGKSEGHTYIIRTELNAQHSDGTVVFGNVDPTHDKGSARTIELAEKHRKPWIQFDLIELNNPARCAAELRQWVIDQDIAVLNIAGNRGSKAPKLESQVQAIVQLAFQEPILEVSRSQQDSGATIRYPLYIDPMSPEQQEAVQPKLVELINRAAERAKEKGYSQVEIYALPGNQQQIQEAIAQIQLSVNILLTSDAKSAMGSPDDLMLLITSGSEQAQFCLSAAKLQGMDVVSYNPQSATFQKHPAKGTGEVKRTL